MTYIDRKITYPVEKDAALFDFPDGAGRAALFALPTYGIDYMVTIKSMVYGIGFNCKIFLPTIVALDSAFNPTHYFSERTFSLNTPTITKPLNASGELVTDSDRKNDKYLLIYTLHKSGQFGTFTIHSRSVGSIVHPVVRSEYGRIELELHAR